MKTIDYDFKNAYFGYLHHLTKKYFPIIAGAFALETLLVTLIYFISGSFSYYSKSLYEVLSFIESFGLLITLFAPFLITFFIYSGAERKHAFSTNVNRRTAYFSAVTVLVICSLISALIAIGLPQLFKMLVYAAHPDAVISPFVVNFGALALEILFSLMFSLAAAGAVFLIQTARISGIKATIAFAALLFALVVLIAVVCVVINNSRSISDDVRAAAFTAAMTSLSCGGVIILNVGAFFVSDKGDMQR